MKKKIFSIVLSLLLGVSCMTACKNNHSSDMPSSENSAIDTIEGVSLVEDGRTEYTIVISDNASGDEVTAADELTIFFKEATGISLKTVTDKNRLFNEDSQYISIGETTIFKQAGLSLPLDIEKEGVYLKTVEKSIFINGGSGLGCVYAVYDFLNQVFNYEYYGRDFYVIDRNVEDLPLCDLDYQYNPSFPFRAHWGGSENYDSKNVMRLRHHELGDFFGSVGGKMVHNWRDFLTAEISQHEGYWIGEGVDNMCYTARGDEAEYNALVQCVTNVLIDIVSNSTVYSSVCIANNDVTPACPCATCTEIRTSYNSNCAAIVLFCNDVRARLDEWFETEEGAPHKREFTFSFLAYMATEDAPVTYDETTGEYIGINGIKCNDGVGVWYAPIYHDYLRSPYHEINKKTVFNMKGWDALTDDLYLWTYDMNFQAYFDPYDTLGDLQEFLKLCEEADVKMYYPEGQQWACKDTAAWANLHVYLNAKLGWDTNCNVKELTEDFFKNFYGPAAEEMYELFMQSRAHTAYLLATNENFGGSFSCETSTTKVEFWPQNLLEQWIEMYQETYEAIEFLKEDDSKLYREYWERIATEEVSPLFIILKLYQGSLSADKLDEYRQRFKYLTTELDFIGNVGNSIESEWLSFGIA